MNISFCRDQIPTQGTKGAGVRAMMREKCTEGGLLLFPLILLYRFGGDSSGGFGGVSGLHVGGGCRDRPKRFAGRDTDGEGEQEERHDD